jgi:hypothetical protein
VNDDQRLAASSKVGISNYVATAALAVLAGAGVLFTYISQNFNPPWTFYLFMGLTAVAVVASIYLGGDGSDATVAEIANGTWDNSRGLWQYDWQAILTLFALLSLIAGTAVGASSKPAVSDSSAKLDAIVRELRNIEKAIGGARGDQARITELERRVRRLERHVRDRRRHDP